MHYTRAGIKEFTVISCLNLQKKFLTEFVDEITVKKQPKFANKILTNQAYLQLNLMNKCLKTNNYSKRLQKNKVLCRSVPGKEANSGLTYETPLKSTRPK